MITPFDITNIGDIMGLNEYITVRAIVGMNHSNSGSFPRGFSPLPFSLIDIVIAF